MNQPLKPSPCFGWPYLLVKEKTLCAKLFRGNKTFNTNCSNRERICLWLSRDVEAKSTSSARESNNALTLYLTNRSTAPKLSNALPPVLYLSCPNHFIRRKKDVARKSILFKSGRGGKWTERGWCYGGTWPQWQVDFMELLRKFGHVRLPALTDDAIARAVRL